MVFYQLRHLWSTGSSMLRAFAEDLERQQTERERRQFLAETNRQQFERRQSAEATLRAAELEAAEAMQAVACLERELRGLNRPWHHFKRRGVVERLDSARSLKALTDSQLEAVRAEFDAVLAEGDVPFPGLSLDARRSTNLAIIAYAEILALRLARTPLLALARSAVLRRDPADEYGGRAECEALMSEIGGGQALLAERTDGGAEFLLRTGRLQPTRSRPAGCRSRARRRPVSRSPSPPPACGPGRA